MVLFRGVVYIMRLNINSVRTHRNNNTHYFNFYTVSDGTWICGLIPIYFSCSNGKKIKSSLVYRRLVESICTPKRDPKFTKFSPQNGCFFFNLYTGINVLKLLIKFHGYFSRLLFEKICASA